MNNNLKVMQIIDSLAPGGAEMMAVNIANGLSNKGINSFLCVTRKEGLLKEKVNSKIKYIYLNRKKRVDINAFKSLYKLIKQDKVDVVHAHSTSIFTGLIMKLCIPSLILIWHDHYGNSETLDGRKSWFLKLAAKKIDSSIVVNDLLENWNRQNLKINSIINIPNFASLNKTVEKNVDLFGENGKRIICLANLRPQKDHLTLLKAFEIVHKEFQSWTLHLVGLDLKDDYSKSINSYINDNKLNEVVFIYGSTQNTYEVLNQSNIGVLASKSEGLPVSLLEYGLVNLPVVVTDVGNCSKLVINNITGLLVPPQNSKELAVKILHLIKNSQKRTLLGANLSRLVAEKYSENHYIKQLITVYLNCYE